MGEKEEVLKKAWSKVIDYLYSNGAEKEAARISLKSLAEGASEHVGMIRQLAREMGISLA